ncbi:MAG: pantetheine-phosphate adenylyltransferase [Oscillospiraceae bacterium]|nr:pantetheine-phosphate adenylyltransferase [Oscillospiraceae bacterium]MDD4368650.1 pantetheine-phosphate adenylyltransferase [Oscillospiraceae bacterium]
MNTFIYPGTFDPPTTGHLDIARRAAALCRHLYVVVLPNASKQACFSVKERVEMLQACFTDLPNCTVDHYNGLLVDYVRLKQASAVVRGIRSESDLRYEQDMATANRLLYRDFEMLILLSRPDLAFTSSSIVREVGSFDGDISAMVPPAIADFVSRRLKGRHQEDKLHE